MTLNNIDDVGAFHTKFGFPSNNDSSGPRELDEGLLAFRVTLMEEELQEFKDAMAAGDDAKMFDALLDLVYVTLGTAHVKGYPWEAGWNLVHAANMTKVKSSKKSTGPERGSSHDVVKPKGFKAANIAGLLKDNGWE